MQIVADNACVNEVSYEYKEAPKHPHFFENVCAAHGMDLSMEDIRNTWRFAMGIKDERRVVTFFHRNPLRAQFWLKKATPNKKGLIKHVET